MPVLGSAKTPPATPAMKDIDFSFVSTSGISISPFSKAQQVQEWPGQLLMAKVNMPAMKRSQAADWMAFFASLRGMVNIFSLQVPAWKTAQGIATGTPVVNGAANGGSSLATRGWTANITGILKAGDWFQVGNHLHMNLNTENSDSGGLASFDIWPDLREVPGDGTPIITTNPAGFFRMTQPKVDVLIDEALIYGFSFECMEAL